MRVLLAGYSSIAQKRVLPALAKLGIRDIDLASRSATNASWPEGTKGSFYADYGEGIRKSSADLVYISTTNDLHATLAELSLREGRHTVVDKPAFLRLEEAERLIEMAARRKLCLAEATVYPFHPQVEAVRKVFAESDSRPERLSAVFSFPPLPADNFRYRAELGGGALWDLGPYAVTPGRVFFGERPEEIVCRITHRQHGVDTAFSVLMIYSGGRSFTGQYGYTTGYRNTLEVLGPQVAVTMERAFTTLPDAPATLRVTQGARQKTIEAEAADTFASFLKEVGDSIAQGDMQRWPAALREDALVLDELRRSAAAVSRARSVEA